MWGLSPQREHFETAKLAGSTDLKIFWVSQTVRGDFGPLAQEQICFFSPHSTDALYQFSLA